MLDTDVAALFPTREDTLCRSIKVLRKQGRPAGAEELNAAALQFVRKISGYRHPSQANQEAFHLAIGEIAAASQRLLDSLVTPGRTPRHKRETRTDKASPGVGC